MKLAIQLQYGTHLICNLNERAGDVITVICSGILANEDHKTGQYIPNEGAGGIVARVIDDAKIGPMPEREAMLKRDADRQRDQWLEQYTAAEKAKARVKELEKKLAEVEKCMANPTEAKAANA